MSGRKMLNLSPELPDETPISEVELSTRIRNALSVGGLKTVGEVREASDATLLSLNDFGQGSLTQLPEMLGLPSDHGVRALK